MPIDVGFQPIVSSMCAVSSDAKSQRRSVAGLKRGYHAPGHFEASHGNQDALVEPPIPGGSFSKEKLQ
jgi:hypothetical protein